MLACNKIDNYDEMNSIYQNDFDDIAEFIRSQYVAENG